MARTKKPKTPKQPKAIASATSHAAYVKSICDIMRRSNCASALQYVPELTWILFLRILDAQETSDAAEAKALGLDFTPALRAPYRWQDWAAPWSDDPDHPKTIDGEPQGWKRKELYAKGDGSCSTSSTTSCCPTCMDCTSTPRRSSPTRPRRPNSASSAAS
jgi:type I restriction enzyme M protein